MKADLWSTVDPIGEEKRVQLLIVSRRREFPFQILPSQSSPGTRISFNELSRLQETAVKTLLLIEMNINVLMCSEFFYGIMK